MSQAFTYDALPQERVHFGKAVREALGAEVDRLGAKRVFVVSGRSVSRNTPLVARIKQLLGENFAGLYDEIGKDTPYENVIAARDKAREAGADLLIAVGALPKYAQQQHRGENSNLVHDTLRSRF